MMKLKYWAITAGVLCMSASGSALFGQNTKTPAKAPTAKTQPVKTPAATIFPDTLKSPKFTVRFGPYTEANPALPDDLKKLLNTDLIITDQRGQKWTPVAFRFIWNRKEINDDWKTGKRKIIMAPSIVEVDGTAKLPATWQKEMTDTLQSGEELIFERIIIEHPESKRKMMAPSLRIKVI